MTMTDEQHRRDLQEQLERGQLALFIGSDLPQEITGLPSRTDLARELARRKGLDESLSLAEVAQRVSQAGNRFEFTSFIRDKLDTTGKSPQPFHRHIVDLVGTQAMIIITTAYDDLLETAFREARVGLNRVVRDADLLLADPKRPTLIKLYGDSQQVDTLVVTDSDHSALLRGRDREAVVDEVRQALRRKTVLFLGYNLADLDFRFLFDQVAKSEFARTAYAVWPGLPESDVRMWRDRRVVILTADPFDILSVSEAPSSPPARPAQTVGRPSLQQPSTAPPPSQPSVTPPQQSRGRPQVNAPPSISLTEQEITLLQDVYQGFDEALIEKEFGEGLSGARALLTLPSKDRLTTAYQVTKLGATPELRQEQANYEKHVKDFLPVYAARVERYCEQGDLAGLNYVFVGGEALGAVMDSLEYYHTHTAEQVIEMLTALLDQALRPWYGQHENLPPRFFADEYSSHLVAHLQLKLRPGSLDALWPTGRPPNAVPDYRQIAVDDIPGGYEARKPETLVSVEGLVITRVKRGRVNLRGPGTQGPFLRVKFPPASDAAQELEVGSGVGVRGEVVYNRHVQMEKIVRDVFPELSPTLESERIELPGVPGTYPNPLKVYPDVLNTPLKGRASYAHGDLHPLNVLVNVLPHGLGRGWLIDFANIEKRHNIFDFVVLETYLRVWELGSITPPLSPEACTQFEKALNAATLGQSATPPSEPRLLKAHQVTLAVRRIARNYMARDSDFLDQYFPALFLYCLGIMRHYQNDGPQAARWVFVAACVLAEYILDDQVTMSVTGPSSPMVQSSLSLPAGVPGVTAGSTWTTAAIRDLLTAALDDEELDDLCTDNFRPVYEAFSKGMSKKQKIHRLLDYCMRHEQVDALLRLVEEHNPTQYARSASRLSQETRL